MKVSLNLMKRHAPEAFNLPPTELALRIGEQLGAVEEVIELAPKYADVKIVEIIEAKPHHNADKLAIYQATDGQSAVQIVSGDVQLQVGDKVAWLAPGTTVPSTFGTDQPFILGAREMRGEMSHGMFASGKELDINDDNSRVQVLDTDAPAGTLFADAYGLNDTIIDIENKMFTHRPDCFGHLGVAREITGIQGLPFTSPEWYAADAVLPKPDAETLKVVIENEIPQHVPRFVAVPLANITIGPSPLWLQSYLRRVGIRPINNVVDITNYYMVLTGQPLHAYDYDKVKALDANAEHPTLKVRFAHEGEKLAILNGKEITLGANDMLVTTATAAACVGGVMGGANTEVDDATTNIILEAATWDMYLIRKTSMAHGLFTDAVTRFNKGQSPLQNTAVIARAIEDLQKFAGATVAGQPVDEYNVTPEVAEPSVVVSADFINNRLGSVFSAGAIADILRNVECNVEEHGDELMVRPPFWRTDIKIAEDVVEEVGRLHGYAKLPFSLPRRDTTATPRLPLEVLRDIVRRTLAAAGNNELQTYSFVSEQFMTRTGQDASAAYRLRNALSPELTYIRTSLLPSLLDKIHANHKAGHDNFGLFEIGKPHNKHDNDEEGLPKEWQMLSYAYSTKKPGAGAAYYTAKYQLDHLLETLHIQDVRYEPLTVRSRLPWRMQNTAILFEPKRAAVVWANDIPLAVVGELSASVRRNFKLPDYSAGFEADLEQLLALQRPYAYRPLVKFPATEQDLCFRVAAAVQYHDLYRQVTTALSADSRLRVTVSPLDIYQRADDADHKQITLRITLQHHDKTLTTAEVNSMLDAASDVVRTALGGERI